MTATAWIVVVVVAGWLAFAVGYFLGHGLGQAKGAATLIEWQALVDDLDDEVRDIRDGLATADATIKQLSRDVDMAWQAGIVQGQLLQAERHAEGL